MIRNIYILLLLAFSFGEDCIIGESFTDTNENGIYDAGEPFIDLGNGIYDDGEPFIDSDNGQYDQWEDFEDSNNGQWDAWEVYYDGNGVYDFGELFIDSNDKYGLADFIDPFQIYIRFTY